MGFNNFQEFLDCLERQGELIRISTEVSAELEITEITDRVTKQQGKALLFENVKNSRFPVVTNAFGSHARVAMALGQSPEDIAKKIESLTTLKVPQGIADKMKLLPRLLDLARIPRRW